MPLFLRLWLYRWRARRDPEWVASWSDAARVDAALQNWRRFKEALRNG